MSHEEMLYSFDEDDEYRFEIVRDNDEHLLQERLVRREDGSTIVVWDVPRIAGQCIEILAAERDRLRGLLQEAWDYMDLDCMDTEAVDDLQARIRQALHREEDS